MSFNSFKSGQNFIKKRKKRLLKKMNSQNLSLKIKRRSKFVNKLTDNKFNIYNMTLSQQNPN
jgi:hypothetical protein